ncbi:PREDICTED: putative neutral sphingomyelinase isoform X1 [Diuraphis noxia]|uniref:putative neutral sphingomyelinase isoform X1 n=1 Tax=Diuraphis noxia TaxID=143948 RepID=UPI000763774F|nr:PREDICTED: putative neutral sphingomyelinase isoform X1 [Diuraphis noxia]
MKLSIFTLNIWGLKFISKNRNARVKALSDSLTNNGYDVVCLQELWCEDDYKYLKASCKNVFKYIHYFHSGMLGSGMCIMSRYPVIDHHYHSFSLNGYLHKIWHGDWFGGKGIGMCRVNVNGFTVDVYTTHLQACYNASNDKYINHRIIQAFEIANLIRITSAGSDLSVLAGDLNCNPNDICYKLVCLVANMIDSHSACLNNSIEYTFNHPQNSYKDANNINDRIDYILYKLNEKNLVVVNEHRHSLPHRVPGQNFSYSDHEPIEAVFEISANTSSTERNITKNSSIKFEDEFKNVLITSLNICNEGNVINPLISLWHFVFVIIFIVFMYIYPYTYIDIVSAITLLIIFLIMWIYNLVIKWTEQNCVRGFRHRIETFFSNQ